MAWLVLGAENAFLSMPLLIDTWIGSSHSSCEYATVNIGVKCLCDVLTSSVKHPAGTHGILVRALLVCETP